MANVTLYRSFSFLADQDWDYNVVTSTASQLALVSLNGRYKQTFTGSFTYDAAENVYGTVTATSFYVDNLQMYAITQLSTNAHTLQAYVEGDDNTQATYQYVLGGNDTFNGSAANDTILGYSGNDSILGNGGNDVLDGGTGADTLKGGVGDDSYVRDHAGDLIVELAGQGFDLVRSSLGCTLTANVEKLVLTGALAINGTGTDTANTLVGNGAANLLVGLGGNDSLVGNAGNDRLDGDLGNDTLVGGAGRDAFRFDTLPSASLNKDTIKGFVVADDTIELENAVFTALASGALPGKDFVSRASGAATAVVAADVNILYDRGSGNLYYDANGGDAAGRVLVATLAGSPDGVTAADFVVT